MKSFLISLIFSVNWLMKSFILWSQNIQILKMKYKCLQGTNFLLFFKFVNIETKSRHVQLKINPIVTSNVTNMISLWDSIEYIHPYAGFGTSCTYKIIAIKFFPNNHVLSWSFPSGTWCTIFLSYLEMGMSFVHLDSHHDCQQG